MAATHAAKQVATGSKRSAALISDPILASKVTAPEVPDWAVARPRITKQIAQGTRWCPLTVVTGPLGAGKTMALAQWAATEPGPVAWVTLDKYDNRPGVFWSYVVTALRRSGVALPKALSAATRGRAAEHPFLLRLASALAAQDPPVTLVVDDFHLLTEPKVLSGLDFLLRNAGAGLRLAAGSQAAPLLPLHRYRLAGELAEIRADDLAFTVAEAGQLLARHGCELSAGSVETLMRHTEGWAAGLRLAAISLAAHPGADRFVTELVTDDSAVTGYLVTEVLDTQPRDARDVLLQVSILEQVNAEIATELTGYDQAGQILTALAHANAFVQPIGGGWYRFHTMFAEVLRRKLRLEFPDLVPALHQRAAEWCERNGRLDDAVRHAARAGDWPLAARMVIDGLAIGELIEPRGGGSMADEFAAMPVGETWAEPHPNLVSAAISLWAGRPESAAATLEVSEKTLDQLPAGQRDAAQLAAVLIRLAAARLAGDLTAAAEAAVRAEALVSRIPGDGLTRHPGIRARVLAARGAAELWSGRFDEAARVLEAGAAAAAAPGVERERIDCLSHLALAEALRGRMGRAAELACQVTAAGPGDGRPSQEQGRSPAAFAALAWIHLERYELREERSALKQLDAALAMSPDRLVGAVACLVAAWDSLAEGHAEAAAQFVGRARSGRPVPAWFEQRLSLAESHALTSAGDIEAALAAAKRADCDSSPEAAVTLARAWAAAGEGDNARAALAPVVAAREGVPDRVRLQASLVTAQVSYHDGDRARGRRSLGHALRLAEREQIRLPFAVERGWIASALQRDPEWAGAHHNLLKLVMPHARLPAPPGGPDEALIPDNEPLTERELQVLRHVSSMLTTAEIASELYISTNTVKSHIKHICHKLAASHRGEAVRRARRLQLI
jgi:LuxR family transcriptional regulator, maltose regulon positive regulatory protein